jgi:uncharacterized membrane protein YkvA (DUF1232 family)
VNVTYTELFAAMNEAGLSPEAAADLFGVSNMTLRRWRERPGDERLPEKYERAFRPALERLAGEGRLSPQAADAAIERRQGEDFRAALKRLGFPDDVMAAGPADQRALVEGLKKVGADPGHKDGVDRSEKRLVDFQRLGAQWKERVGGLMRVLRAGEIGPKDKVVAYGALFYLLTPIDLIPDSLAAIGFLDDFVMLGIALWFYRDKFPRLFKGRPAS